MNSVGRDTSVAIRICRNRRDAEQYALVLSAMGIQSQIAAEGELVTICVAQEDHVRANSELMAHDYEKLKDPGVRERKLSPFLRFEAAMTYWAILLFFFAVGRHNTLSLDWVAEGAAQAGIMFAGEWWRAVTALCLHIDSAHLFGNLVFGTFFFLLLSQLIGAGAAGLAMVSAGTAGNVINALVHSSAHTSIGASTAIFAGLGILVVLRQSQKRYLGASNFRAWTPVAAGLGLLAFLGFSGGNTDILAHVFGFGSGIALGYWLSRWDQDWSDDARAQWKYFGTTLTIILAAWILAVGL